MYFSSFFATKKPPRATFVSFLPVAPRKRYGADILQDSVPASRTWLKEFGRRCPPGTVCSYTNDKHEETVCLFSIFSYEVLSTEYLVLSILLLRQLACCVLGPHTCPVWHVSVAKYSARSSGEVSLCLHDAHCRSQKLGIHAKSSFSSVLR